MQLLESEEIRVQSLSPKIIQDLAYAQVPTGKTLLHILAGREKGIDYALEKAQNPKEDYYLACLLDRDDKLAIHYTLQRLMEARFSVEGGHLSAEKDLSIYRRSSGSLIKMAG